MEASQRPRAIHTPSLAARRAAGSWDSEPQGGSASGPAPGPPGAGQGLGPQAGRPPQGAEPAAGSPSALLLTRSSARVPEMLLWRLEKNPVSTGDICIVGMKA